MSQKDDLFAFLSEEEKSIALAAVTNHKFGTAAPTSSTANPANAPASPPLTGIPMREIIETPRPPLQYLVEGLIARGHLALLSGRPKSGKSWLVMQLAMAVDTGAPFLGKPTTPGHVLYLALEDGERRLHERGRLLGWSVQNQTKARFVLPTLSAPNGDLGPGLDEVHRLAAEFDLIILDTLSAALSGRVSENDNAAMGAIVNELARIAHNTDTTILVVHHIAKGIYDDDKFNSVRGASAIRAAYDVGMLLEHKAGEPEGLLRVESRDADVEGMTIRRISGGAGWELVGAADEIRRIRAGRKVIEALGDFEEGATAEELSEALGISKASAHRQLQRAERDGLVIREQQKATGAGRPADRWFLNNLPPEHNTEGVAAHQDREFITVDPVSENTVINTDKSD